MWFKNLREDIKAAKINDPAARNSFEIWLTYSGVHALSWHRVAYFFHKKLRMKLIARIISQLARFFTGVEIHPAAWIEGGVFIDHGSGVVIGETAEVHKGTVIYQGVTLGGTGKERGKRHPTVMEDVTLSAGAKVLGGFTVGKGAKIGAGAVVLKEVPEYATVVGVPGRIVRIRKPDDAEKTHSGVIAVTALNAEIAVEELERKEEEAKALAREAEEKRSGKKKTEKKVEETEKKDENL
ncbi:MAG: serine O-acetyltransferase [Clostridia bacterium]|nr:serine O-acetyltransferase [Clostridia bacterium]